MIPSGGQVYIKLVIVVFVFVTSLFEIGSWLIIEQPDHWTTSLFFRAYIIALLLTTHSFIKKGDRNGLKRQDQSDCADAGESTP